MPRVSRFPAYPTKAHGSGQARIKVRGRDVYLGLHGSPESWKEYARHLEEWQAQAADGQAKPISGNRMTVGDMASRFLAYADLHYRHPDGSHKSEYESFTVALRPLNRLYGHTLLRDFGPLAMKALRQSMASGSWMTPEDLEERKEKGKPSNWSRKTINRNLVRIKTVFAWAESEELVPGATVHALRTVRGLPIGTPGVREMPKVLPVPESDLHKTLDVLGHVVAGLVNTQLLTGARPGEIVTLRPCDLVRERRVEIERGVMLDTQGKVWVYKPASHKTAHHAHQRVILFGPRAQKVLAPFLLGRDPQAPIFSPRESVEVYLRAHGRAINHARRRRPRDQYTVASYDRAIRQACKRAKVQHWHPHQLRHNAATRLVDEFGWDVARIVLGHRTISTTQVYALDSIQKAVKAISKVG